MKLVLSVFMILSVLLSVRPVIADTVNGKVLFEAKACYSCHALGGKGAKMGPGPALDGVGKKRNKAWLTEHLKDPVGHRERDPASHTGVIPMPKIELTDQEIKDLVDYLLTLK